MSVNTLITGLMRIHYDWAGPAKKYRMVTMSEEDLRGALGLISIEDMAKLGTTLGKTVPKAIISFLYGRVDSETFMKWLDCLSRYQNWAELSITKSPNETVVAAHHEMGRKWSTWLASYLTGACDSILSVSPRAELGDDNVRLTIPRLQRNAT